MHIFVVQNRRVKKVTLKHKNILLKQKSVGEAEWKYKLLEKNEWMKKSLLIPSSFPSFLYNGLTSNKDFPTLRIS